MDHIGDDVKYKDKRGDVDLDETFKARQEELYYNYAPFIEDLPLDDSQRPEFTHIANLTVDFPKNNVDNLVL